jgi:hypothetical protein
MGRKARHRASVGLGVLALALMIWSGVFGGPRVAWAIAAVVILLSIIPFTLWDVRDANRSRDEDSGGKSTE